MHFKGQFRRRWTLRQPDSAPGIRPPDFKLHAPARTVIEGTYRGGRFDSLRVTPASHRKDLVMPPQNP
jgi:hypothetical protein